MNAGRILREAGYDTPELRDAIAPIDPDEINVWPASRWLRMLWRPGIKGVTQGRWIFAHPDLFDDRKRLARLVVHELVHVRQFEEAGYPLFIFRYLRDYVSGRLSGVGHREAYLNNPAEVEAREITSRVT